MSWYRGWPANAAIDRMLRAHQPYPAIVVDAHWNAIAANRASASLFGREITGVNIARSYLANPAAAEMVVTWPEVGWSGPGRLRRQLRQVPSPLPEHDQQ